MYGSYSLKLCIELGKAGYSEITSFALETWPKSVMTVVRSDSLQVRAIVESTRVDKWVRPAQGAAVARRVFWVGILITKLVQIKNCSVF